ncbi:unnamed protein product [Withania somnifera]
MASIFSCFCGEGFEKDRSIRRDWSFPHSPPLDPDLSDVEEGDEYYTYPQKSVTNIVGSTTKVVYTNDDDTGGSGYITDEGICYENDENNSVNDSVNGVIYSTSMGDGGYEYDDGEYDVGSDDGYVSGDGGEEGGGDGNYSGDDGGDYESA